MRILLTGSTGFVGTHLLEALKRKKHTIVAFARGNGGNILDPASVAAGMKNIDIVIHAAAEIDETKSPEELFQTNVQGTKNLLAAAEKNKIQQFIFLSTVGVYGDTRSKLNEDSPVQPITPYEKSKSEAEKAVLEYQEVFPVTIIRPALVLGPNKYWKSIFHIIEKGFPLIGKGENAWQMIYIKDLVEFIAKCVGNEDAYGETFICAEKETHSLREVVDMIAEAQGKKHIGSIPGFLGMGLSYLFLVQSKLTGKKNILIPAHVKRLSKHREYAIAKAMRLGWVPRYSTREAIEETQRALSHPSKEN
ncbi:MAG: NAD-dependent epimerase/dehydratase family protein [Candidatus Iainarchaeum archaeon]|uniref:NAD-dependent epimerase/dehydratase family protein n=1 Tax=Candidatus Iainarchaeum sp. TaxID=3101447 RepID=A0A7T9I1V3_9ARCH|nr:MAG: NAD-dependent epimerase/dehydratase family protein [Candidatus Diapherotrites archaeon]